MDRDQLSILYREFLFRMVDRDLLSVHAGGDISKLLGRMAAILVWISLPFGGMAIAVAGGATVWPIQSVIATTMLVVSIFCVLAWDSLLPDRRDVLVLTPLGVSAATLFAARFASMISALGTAVVVFNAFPGVLFPFALTPAGSSLLEVLFSVHLYRAAAAYWVTMLLSGTFILLAVAFIQAIPSQLPRQLALRVSSILQIAIFCVAVGVYFLQPSVTSAEQLARSDVQQRIVWLPSYWFLGLFHQLNESQDGPARAVLAGLAQRAWTALATMGAGAAAAVLTSCVSSLWKAAEQSDIVPSRKGRSRLWTVGASPEAAILYWTVRTLLRSRQHRVLVSFYSGIGFAAIVLFLHTRRVQVMSRAATTDLWSELDLPLICASVVMMVCWIVGVRAAFAVPVELRANWIFRVTLTAGPAEPLAAVRESLFVAGLVPVWSAAAVGFVWLWPLAKAAQHLLIMALVGTALVACCLWKFRRIPFAYAYLPGTSHIHITLALCVLLGLNVLFWCADLERRALADTALYLRIIGFLVAFAVACWWRLRDDKMPHALDFDEPPAPAILTLGLEHGRQ